VKNDYEIRGEVTVIYLNSPKYGRMETIISTSKLDTVKEFKNTWYAAYDRKTKSFYAVGNLTISLNKRTVYGLHQWIKDIPKGLDVDHINHDTLNNTDENIRIVKPIENKQNKKGARSDSKSGIRGVGWDGKYKKWIVEIKVHGKRKYFGRYENIEEAKQAAIEARKKYMPFSV
jgi:hypothetical protein